MAPKMSLAQTILINEVFSCGDSEIIDEFGEPVDWIELYNPSASPINLTRSYLSDDPDYLNKWSIPDTTIAGHDYLLILASGNDWVGPFFLHTNFELKCSGEDIILSDASGILDQISGIALADGLSYGKCPDGSINQGKLDTPSPAGSNDSSSLIVFSVAGGFYAFDQSLTLTNSNAQDIIRYTLDGSEPTITSASYTAPIILSDRSSEPNSLSNVNSSPFSGSNPPIIYKGTVVRAARFKNNSLIGNVESHTYFVSTDALTRHSDFDVLALTTDSLSLFDHDTGIYIPGANYTGEAWTGNYYEKGSEWERTGNLEYFNTTGELQWNQSIGFRIHGGATRRGKQKSLRFYARNEYDAKYFGAALIPGRNQIEFKRFILRTSFAGRNKTLFKDLLTARLSDSLSFGVMLGKPVLLFINGEYWGIHDLREYTDRHYLEYQFEVDPDHVDLLTGNAELNPLLNGGVVEGSNQGWHEVQEYIAEHTLSEPQNYEHISGLIEMNSLIDYYASEVFFKNYDWPKNNCKYWRSADPITPFQYILHDLDAGWGFTASSYDMIEHVSIMEPNLVPNPPYANRLFNKLLENDQFVNSFLDRLACLMINEFSAQRLLLEIDQLRSEYEPGIDLHWERWYQNDPSAWNDSIQEVLIDFAESRHEHLIDHVESHFGIDFDPEIRCLFAGQNSTLQVSNKILVYPNPSSTYTEIQGPNNGHHWDMIVQDQLGRVQYQWSNDSVVRIDTSDWPNGVYFVSAKSMNHAYNAMLVVQH
jgi:hypothetical protein